MPGFGTGFHAAQFTGPGCCSITHQRPRPTARYRSWLNAAMSGCAVSMNGARSASVKSNCSVKPSGYESQVAKSSAAPIAQWSKSTNRPMKLWVTKRSAGICARNTAACIAP